MISSGVTPFLGVSITSTAVVFGTATLGAPGAPPDCECAEDAAGRAAMRRGITNFIGLSFRFRPVRFLLRVDPFLQLTMGCIVWPAPATQKTCFRLEYFFHSSVLLGGASVFLRLKPMADATFIKPRGYWIKR